jgi:hypothetical protein
MISRLRYADDFRVDKELDLAAACSIKDVSVALVSIRVGMDNRASTVTKINLESLHPNATPPNSVNKRSPLRFIRTGR